MLTISEPATLSATSAVVSVETGCATSDAVAVIGDLFTDRVDCVWEPLETLYQEGASQPVMWNTPGVKDAPERQNELILPEGVRP